MPRRGPFYCPGDKHVSIAFELFQELHDMFCADGRLVRAGLRGSPTKYGHHVHSCSATERIATTRRTRKRRGALASCRPTATPAWRKRRLDRLPAAAHEGQLRRCANAPRASTDDSHPVGTSGPCRSGALTHGFGGTQLQNGSSWAYAGDALGVRPLDGASRNLRPEWGGLSCRCVQETPVGRNLTALPDRGAQGPPACRESTCTCAAHSFECSLSWAALGLALVRVVRHSHATGTTLQGGQDLNCDLHAHRLAVRDAQAPKELRTNPRTPGGSTIAVTPPAGK